MSASSSPWDLINYRQWAKNDRELVAFGIGRPTLRGRASIARASLDLRSSAARCRASPTRRTASRFSDPGIADERSSGVGQSGSDPRALAGKESPDRHTGAARESASLASTVCSDRTSPEERARHLAGSDVAGGGESSSAARCIRTGCIARRFSDPGIGKE